MGNQQSSGGPRLGLSEVISELPGVTYKDSLGARSVSAIDRS